MRFDTPGALPCPTCPWRLDQGRASIPHYSHQKACRLMDTVGAEDGFRKIMACHGSTEDNKIICKGYLAREGWRNLNVRLLMLQGGVHMDADVLDACRAAGVKLHRTYKAVLKKLGRGLRCGRRD